jgi:hypothetical protein
MTTLVKPIRREVAVPRMRPVIVTIDPDLQSIILREKSCRKEYSIRIQTLYTLLVKQEG